MFSNNGYDVIDQIDKTITTENTDPAAAPPEVDNQEAPPKKRTCGRCGSTSDARQIRWEPAELRATLILMGENASRGAHNSLGIVLALFIISLSAAVANAQGPVISNVTVDSKTYSTARIQWISSIATGIARVQYDSLTSTLPFANSTQLKGSSTANTVQGYTLGGLAPATTYYFVACSTANSIETCSSVYSFTTAAAPAGWPTIIPTPTLPTVSPLPAMPTVTTTYTVGSNCNDPVTGLQAYINTAAAAGLSTNQAILIPPSDTCIGNYALPVNTGTGWIVIRTAAPDSSLPPEGVRIDSTYASVMPTVSALAAYGNVLSGCFYVNSTTSNWRFVGLQWTAQTGQHDLMGMIYGQTTNMIFDRNIFFANGGNGDYISPAAIIANGVNTWISNNYINVIVPGSLAVAIDMTAAQGMLIDNNYIDAPGISVFAQENALTGANAPQGSNYQISRNLFAWNPAYINNSITRQHIEWKAGNLILINGNTFTSEWNGGNTGSYSNAIELTPRNGNGTKSFSNSFADITITNNSFYQVPGGIQLWGGENNEVVVDVPATQRVLIQNNLFHDVNGFYAKTGFTAFGCFLSLAYALEGLTVNHNTMLGNRGAIPVFFAWNGGPGASIRFTNNILTATGQGGLANLLWGADTADQLPAAVTSQATPVPLWHGIATASPNTDPASFFTNNVIVPGVTDTSVDANYSNPAYAYTPANCTSYWSALARNYCAGNSGTTTANAVLQSLGLFGPITNLTGYAAVANWRLRSTSTYISGARYTTDGLDAGANIDQIEAAQGVVSNVHTFPTSMGPTIGFLAPDSFSCSIDVDPSSDSGNFTPGVFSRVSGNAVSGNGAQRAEQNVLLTGLTAHAQYTLRVNCSSQQPTITLQLP